MNRAVVIKTVGDPQIAGAILDGMTQKVIPLDDGELAAVKAEYAKLQAKDARLLRRLQNMINLPLRSKSKHTGDS